MVFNKLAAITFLLGDPATLAEVADAADREGRTALADLIDDELRVMADDTGLRHDMTELLIAEHIDRNRLLEIADHLRQAGLGKYADRLLNAGGQGARLMVVRDILRFMEEKESPPEEKEFPLGIMPEKESPEEYYEESPSPIDPSQCFNCLRPLEKDEGVSPPVLNGGKVCLKCEYSHLVIEALAHLRDSGKLSPKDKRIAHSIIRSFISDEDDETFQKALAFLRKHGQHDEASQEVLKLFSGQKASDPMSFLPTPNLEDIPTETGSETSGVSPYFGKKAPMGRVPTVEDVMKAISTQTPLDPSELRDMPEKDLELLRARLGMALNMVEKAMGAEPTFLLNPKEQEKHEEAETLRGTIGASKPALSKRTAELSELNKPIPSEPHRKEVEDVSKKLSDLTTLVLQRIADELTTEKHPVAEPLQKVIDELGELATRLMDIGEPLTFRGEPMFLGGASKLPLSKRGAPWDFTPEAAIEHLKKLEKEKGEDTYLSKYPFPEKPSGTAAALEPLHRMVVGTFPRIKEMAKNVGWKLLNNLPEDRAELERLWLAASSLSSEMADTGDEYVRAVTDVAHRTANKMKLAEEEKVDREDGLN